MGDDGLFFDAALCAGGALLLLVPPVLKYGTAACQKTPRAYTGKAKAKADLGASERAEVDAAFRLAKARLLEASKACVQYLLMRLYQRDERVQARLDELSKDTRDDVEAFLDDPALKGHSPKDLRAALFPGKGMLSDTSGLQEYDAPCSKIVARNWNKGKGVLHKAGYEVCLQSKVAHELNEVEMVVAVLLHEVAHTIHREHVGTKAHGPEFNRVNNFLVSFARCELQRASLTEKRRWRAPDNTDSRWMQITNPADSVNNMLRTRSPGLRDFDVSKFSNACDQGGSENPKDWPRFCGIKAPIGACDRGCKA